MELGVFKNIHQRDMCSEEIRLRAQNMSLTIPNSIVNIVGRTYHLIGKFHKHEDLHFDYMYIYIYIYLYLYISSLICEESGYNLDLLIIAH